MEKAQHELDFFDSLRRFRASLFCMMILGGKLLFMAHALGSPSGGAAEG